MTFTRRYRFSASHRLHTDELSEDRNREVFGKCNNPHGHGHNYVMEVTVEGSIDPATGRIVNPSALDRYVRQHVLDSLDHRDLNTDVPEFTDVVSTTENLAIVVDVRLREQWHTSFPAATLAGVRIEETPRNSFEVRSI